MMRLFLNFIGMMLFGIFMLFIGQRSGHFSGLQHGRVKGCQVLMDYMAPWANVTCSLSENKLTISAQNAEGKEVTEVIEQ